LHSLVRWIIRFLFALLSRVDVVGIDKVPQEGGALLASNHVGRLDAPLVFSLLKRQQASCLVAKKYQKNPFVRWLINATSPIWIDRQQADFRALREAINFIRDGGALGISPEGTRSRSGALGEVKTGVAYLADKAGAPIVPIGITGTENALSQLLRFRRPQITVRFGEPFYLSPVRRQARDADLARNTDEIMCQIAVLLPPEYRGVYAGHARLLELIQDDPS
jgi:1-acyl-sn-glycerol-3-phosphate acyltransferase